MGIWFPTIKTGTGSEVYTLELVKALQNKGVIAEITWLPHRAEYAPWSVRRLEIPAWATIVHVNSWFPIHLIKGLKSEVSVVVTVHHCVHDEKFDFYKTFLQRLYHKWWVLFQERVNLRRANRIIAVSQYTADQVKSVFGESEVSVIYNALNSDSYFVPNSSRKQHVPFRLLYVGSWSRRKGVDLLSPIMQKLGEEFELMIVNDFCKVKEAFSLENIEIIPRAASKSDLIKIYADADALLFPTRLEGFGLVALEAQATGLPIIASNCSALPEVVKDGYSGILCPMDDVSAFVKAIRTLRENPGLWNRLVDGAYENAQENFSSEKMTDAYLEIYCSI